MIQSRSVLECIKKSCCAALSNFIAGRFCSGLWNPITYSMDNYSRSKIERWVAKIYLDILLLKQIFLLHETSWYWKYDSTKSSRHLRRGSLSLIGIHVNQICSSMDQSWAIIPQIKPKSVYWAQAKAIMEITSCDCVHLTGNVVNRHSYCFQVYRRFVFCF